MNANKKQRIERAINGLKSLHFVSAIILFGSEAGGNAGENSDIDLAVITERIGRDEEIEIIGKSDDLIQISLFHRLPLVIQFRVFKEGKVLFCRNKNTIDALRMRTILTYLDFVPFINGFYNRVFSHV